MSFVQENGAKQNVNRLTGHTLDVDNRQDVIMVTIYIRNSGGWRDGVRDKASQCEPTDTGDQGLHVQDARI